MDHAQFNAMIITPDTPVPTDFERVAAYAHLAGKDELSEALGRPSIHPLYRHLLAQALQQRVLEAEMREREDARERERLQSLQDDDAQRREREQAAPRRRRVR
jgi:hypothetical protein